MALRAPGQRAAAGAKRRPGWQRSQSGRRCESRRQPGRRRADDTTHFPPNAADGSHHQSAYLSFENVEALADKIN